MMLFEFRTRLTEKSLFPTRLCESMSEKDKLGFFYIIEYLYSHISRYEWVEDRYDQLRMAIERDLTSVIDDLFSSLKVAYEEWLQFHLTNSIYIGYVLANISYRTQGYSIVYDPLTKTIQYTEEGDVHTLVNVNLKHPLVVTDVELMKKKREEWNNNPSSWVFRLSDEELAVAMCIADFYYEPIRPDKVWLNARYCQRMINLHLAVWDDRVPQLVYGTHRQFLADKAWQNIDLRMRCATLSLVINTKHHTVKMGQNIGGNAVTVAYLDRLSSLGERLPVKPKLEELPGIYLNWENYL